MTSKNKNQNMTQSIKYRAIKETFLFAFFLCLFSTGVSRNAVLFFVWSRPLSSFAIDFIEIIILNKINTSCATCDKQKKETLFLSEKIIRSLFSLIILSIWMTLPLLVAGSVSNWGSPSAPSSSWTQASLWGVPPIYWLIFTIISIPLFLNSWIDSSLASWSLGIKPANKIKNENRKTKIISLILFNLIWIIWQVTLFQSQSFQT